MTPLPKKKHAKSRTRTRKAAISLRLPSLVTCPNCQGLRFPHRACPNCGYYKGNKSAKVSDEKKE
ncbi:50S ribosomal protein L32 [Candidatus Curtissbacteria bacterium]|nr:50S ribosomal protein L32 [Candidatus Curtissbacteria bacterium]